MTAQGSAESHPVTSRYMPVLLLLFVGSGCAALVYEIVWFQLLELVIGSSAISLGVLLGTFMGGMCLGSLLLPRVVAQASHPLRVYAALELGIACFGVLILLGLPVASNVYAAIASPGALSIVMRGILCAVFLLVPTMCMGATLPAIARWVEATPAGVSWLGFFYGSNLAGAVFGSLFTGFYLLRVYDVSVATGFAAAINVGVALLALLLASKTGHHPARHAIPERGGATPSERRVYLAIALSGMTALAAEVIWTRLLSLMLGGTVYTFSLILAVMLVGLGVGSAAGSFLARSGARSQAGLGWCQMLLPIGIAWTAYMVSVSLPFWPVHPILLKNPWLYFQFDMMRAGWAVLPATLLWGASFPLAIAAIAKPGQDPGRLVGRVYAANTVGAIVGALAFSVFVIPFLGTRGAQQVLIVLAVSAGLLMLLPLEGTRNHQAESGAGVLTGSSHGIFAIGTLLVAGFLLLKLPKIPPGLIAYGRLLPTYSTLPEFLYVGEGMNSSIAVSRLSEGWRNFHVSGKVEASSEPQDMRLQRLLGHISALVQGNPETVLVVGFGAGVTAGTFVLYPGIKRIVICELEPLIPRMVGPYFKEENYDILNDPRVEIVYDDARHFILTTKEKFDVITSDPIHPWVKGAATLYTKEYLELARKHLKPGGVMTEWVPLYESHSDAVKSELATFLEVFPGGTVWANNQNGRGYDLVALGQAEPTRIDVEALNRWLLSPQAARITASLAEVGITSSIDLFANYGGRQSDLAQWLRGAAINRDRNLRLQYLAGMSNNSYDNADIYDEIARQRTFPEALFTAPEEWKASLSAITGLARKAVNP